MGQTKFQRFIFTLMMCFFMVSGMTIYNLYLSIGPSGHILQIMIKDFWHIFAIALFLDVFIVSSLAKGLAFSIIDKGKISSPPVKILMISTFMVTGMVLFMSIYGSIAAVGFSDETLKVYPRIAFMNFIMAWPLNLLIVNPLVRFLHKSFFMKQLSAA